MDKVTSAKKSLSYNMIPNDLMPKENITMKFYKILKDDPNQSYTLKKLRDLTKHGDAVCYRNLSSLVNLNYAIKEKCPCCGNGTTYKWNLKRKNE